MFKSTNASPLPSRSQLTQNGLNSLLDQSAKGITIQIISAELLPEKQPGSLKYKVVISDGCAKHKAVLGNKAALTFRSAGMPTFAMVIVRDLMQLNVTSPKRLIILTDIEIINTSLTGTIGYPIEYQEWQQQVQQYETIQKNHQSNSKPFFLDDNEHTGALPPAEEIVPRSVIMENSMSFQETEVSRQQEFKPTNTAMKQESSVGIEKFAYKPKPTSVDKDNKMMIAKYANSNGNTQAQAQTQPQPQPHAKSLTPEKESKPVVERSMSANLQQSLTTATETDSDSEIEIEKPKPELKKQNSISSLKNEKQNIVSERNIKKLIQFPVFGMNVRALEDNDCTQFHQAIGMDQAFSVDLLDKNGNKVTAVFFGEQAENFLKQFQDHDTHIISNLTGKMSIEK